MRTAAKDQNYLSLNQQSIVWFAGTGQEREDPGPLSQPLELLPEDPKQWDSILKCSGRKWQILRDVRIAQGKENALDINNLSCWIDFKGQWGVIGQEGEQIFTIKGGSHDIKLSGPVYSTGTDVDVELGAWADQSFDPVYDIDLSGLYHAQGRPLTIEIGRVKNPLAVLLGMSSSIKLPKDCKVRFWKSLGEIAYWWGKFVAVKIGLFKK